MRRRYKIALVGLVISAAVFLLAHQIGRGWLGERHDAGTITRRARPIATSGDRQILFGDLHVHTTFSYDAYMISLPMYQGEGAHPLADACDFARFCSALDFWSINDHAEGLTPLQWQQTKESVRQCNEVAGNPAHPDMVTFLGWEWTQIGTTPETHYGHKNIILRDVEEERVPPRPISSRRELFPPGSGARPLGPALRLLLIAAAPGSETRQPYHDLARFLQDRDDIPPCPENVSPRELPAGCQEGATTPTELFRRLDDWGFPHFVIPHGNTWGIYTPPNSSWDRQLAAHRDPAGHEPLIEVFSGHGNSEEYRPWRSVDVDDRGRRSCPRPSPGYTPECWRAGEIIRERCRAARENDDECERRAVLARQNHAEAGIAGHLTVPGADVEDWLNAGQCTDCYMPSYNYRPGGATQYALALTNFDGAAPKRFRFGFIASSDIHTARPGTGYKERDRRLTTDAGVTQVGPPKFGTVEPSPHSIALPPDSPATSDFERAASFFGTAGLVAVHSAGRSRGEIWDALDRREVYGTSGDRILLWFDWLGDPARNAAAPMGSELATTATPRFRVRAVGAFHQRPGCPEHSVAALGSEALHRLCRGECYNPGEVRKRITRIEVIRIRPQIAPDEPIADLVEDPWLVLPCPDAAQGCSVQFLDPDYASAGRDAIYYARAIQEPTDTVNGAGLRCEFDAEGRCIATDPCYGNTRTDYDDDCLAPAEERAWSSPIYLVYDDKPALQ